MARYHVHKNNLLLSFSFFRGRQNHVWETSDQRSIYMTYMWIEFVFKSSYLKGCWQKGVKHTNRISQKKLENENQSHCVKKYEPLVYLIELYSWIRHANFGLDMINLALARSTGGSLRISFWFISCLKIWHETIRFIHTDYVSVSLESRYSLTILGARFSASRWGNLHKQNYIRCDSGKLLYPSANSSRNQIKVA